MHQTSGSRQMAGEKEPFVRAWTVGDYSEIEELEAEAKVAAEEWARQMRIESRNSLRLLELFSFLEEARAEAESSRERVRFEFRRQLVAREIGRRGRDLVSSVKDEDRSGTLNLFEQSEEVT